VSPANDAVKVVAPSAVVDGTLRLQDAVPAAPVVAVHEGALVPEPSVNVSARPAMGVTPSSFSVPLTVVDVPAPIAVGGVDETEVSSGVTVNALESELGARSVVVEPSGSVNAGPSPAKRAVTVHEHPGCSPSDEIVQATSPDTFVFAVQVSFPGDAVNVTGSPEIGVPVFVRVRTALTVSGSW